MIAEEIPQLTDKINAKQRQVTSRGQVGIVAKAVQYTRPRVAPYVGASKILDRPFLSLSGRRHVPKLVNANRVPILRLKKPQSPFLSRIIRDQVNTREARILLSNRLAADVLVAQDEDAWDHILAQSLGLHHDQNEKLWVTEVHHALYELHHKQDVAINKRIEIAERMHKIVEQEKALAEEETSRLEDERHKSKKAKRLSRKVEDSSSDLEKITIKDARVLEDTTHSDAVILSSDPEKFLAEDAPAQEETMRRKLEYAAKKWQGSPLPWTDEELSEIKAARAKRKEVKALAKAAKVKMKEETEKYWAKKLGKTAEQSTTIPFNVGGDARSVTNRGKLISKLRQGRSVRLTPGRSRRSLVLGELSLKPHYVDGSPMREQAKAS